MVIAARRHSSTPIPETRPLKLPRCPPFLSLINHQLLTPFPPAFIGRNPSQCFTSSTCPPHGRCLTQDHSQILCFLASVMNLPLLLCPIYVSETAFLYPSQRCLFSTHRQRPPPPRWWTFGKRPRVPSLRAMTRPVLGSWFMIKPPFKGGIEGSSVGDGICIAV